MRKTGFVLLIVLLVVLLLNSCFSIGKSTGNLFGGGPSRPRESEPAFASDAKKSASDRASAEIFSATGLSGMTYKLMFNIVYAQVFFIGGFGAGFYPLEETQGCIWRIESKDEDGKISRVEAERALLKKLPNGDEWWFLAWRVDNDVFEFEALMTSDLYARKIRYFNPDVKRIEEAKFDDPSSGDSATLPPPEPAAGSLNISDLPRYLQGKETIRINSGTYNTDRLEWSFVNEDEKTTYKYTWWVDAKAAGGLVKYLWTKSGSKESLTGELYSLRKGYTSKFNSF